MAHFPRAFRSSIPSLWRRGVAAGLAGGLISLASCSDAPTTTAPPIVRPQASIADGPVPGPLASTPSYPLAVAGQQLITRDGRVSMVNGSASTMRSNLSRGSAPNASVTQSTPAPMSANVSNSGLVSLDFEGYTANTALTTQYSQYGVTFAGANVAVQNVNLNPPFPPHSGTTIVYDVVGGGGTITLSFATPVSSAAAFITGNQPIGLTCVDRNGKLVGSAALPTANYTGSPSGLSPNYLLAVTGSGIMKCIFQGGAAGNSYSLDDLSFDPTSRGQVPPGPSGRSFIANQTFVCHENPTPIPYGYFTTGWTRRLECDKPCPLGVVCLPDGMNALTLEPWIDKPIGHEMKVCFYDTDTQVNFQPRTRGQLWTSFITYDPGRDCSYTAGSSFTAIFHSIGTQKYVRRVQ